ncbi:MAG: histidine phosphatase family protein [Prevotellaceae bacterium]|nr:histidine phosphatase family protein [Prevotellaceae bacterium]MDY6200245.1 histidine phosphatase family protein [Prevotella sp.]
MTVLYLARHGETVDNANQILQGRTQGMLNEKGQEQAENLAKSLDGIQIDAVIASDLKRAVDTAEVIAKRRSLPLITTPLLRERDWGSFTGRFIPDLKDVPWPDDVESMDAMMERARLFMDWLRRDYSQQTVVAVGHGIINKVIQAVYYNTRTNKIPRMTNAEVRKLIL